jgi:hypothetical protein
MLFSHFELELRKRKWVLHNLAKRERECKTDKTDKVKGIVFGNEKRERET